MRLKLNGNEYKQQKSTSDKLTGKWENFLRVHKCRDTGIAVVSGSKLGPEVLNDRLMEVINRLSKVKTTCKRIVRIENS